MKEKELKPIHARKCEH